MISFLYISTVVCTPMKDVIELPSFAMSKLTFGMASKQTNKQTSKVKCDFITFSIRFCIHLLQNYSVDRCDRVAKFCDEQINSWNVVEKNYRL